ncbi:MAG TPA: FliH/SctL family protein [Candidatus Brocadiia bacterium]|nr:FliH/SctL family protein [Candidatus Brocadiia bacterium]
MAHDQIILQALDGPPNPGQPQEPEGPTVEELLAARDASWQARLEAERAAAEAQRQKAAAQAAAEAQKARREGAQEGRSQALAEMEQKLAGAFAAFEAGLGQLNQAATALIESVSPQAVALATAIAEKVIASEVQTQPSVIQSVFTDAMRQVRGREVLRVRLNPGDLENLQRALATGPQAPLAPDPEIPPGGCVVETAAGAFDSTIATRLRDALDALWETTHDPGA